jgi:hypothetical protein
MYPTPEVAKASRDILLLLKKGTRTTNYLRNKVGSHFGSAIVFLAFQDLIDVDTATYKIALERLKSLGTSKNIDQITDKRSIRAKKSFENAKYFLSKRGKAFVNLLLEKESYAL